MWTLTSLVKIITTYFLLGIYQHSCTDWEGWWSYSGISGPDFWGIMNHDYRLCTTGKRQSPVNIDPVHLIYDPQLTVLDMGDNLVSGRLENTGHDIRYIIEPKHSTDELLVYGGPLSYQYRITDVVIHFGSTDTFGSEHTVAGKQYPGEVQIMGFNKILYDNYTQAARSPNGLVGISMFLRIGSRTSDEFSKFSLYFKEMRYKGANTSIEDFSVMNLVTTLTEYMTYDGSETRPGCKETVRWIILNKPIYTTREEMRLLRRTMQRHEDIQQNAMSNNFRPCHQLNGRAIYTNINPSNASVKCSMQREIYYQANVEPFQGHPLSDETLL